MGEAKRCVFVEEVEVLSTLVSKLFAIMDDLPAASDTAARTGHDFHKIIVNFPALNLLEQTSRIAKSADNSRFYYRIADPDFSGFYALAVIADILECIRIRVLACYEVVCGTKGSLHNTA